MLSPYSMFGGPFTPWHFCPKWNPFEQRTFFSAPRGFIFAPLLKINTVWSFSWQFWQLIVFTLRSSSSVTLQKCTLAPSYVFSIQELTLTLVLPPLLTPKSQCKHLMEQPEVLSLVNDISMCSGATSTTVGVLLGFFLTLPGGVDCHSISC